MVYLSLRSWVRSGLVLAACASLLAAADTHGGLSHVRVVRLSYVSGTVAVKKPGSTEWAKAIVNTPLQEGFSLETSQNSYAEVEFENGSTARFGENSHVDFTQLAMDSEGNKLNEMTFDRGYGTFHVEPEHGDVYRVKVAGVTVVPDGKSEFRTDIAGDHLRLEVFNGSVRAERQGESVKVGKDKLVNLDAQGGGPMNVQAGVVKDSWDQWTHARDQQAILARNDSPLPTRNYLYGWNDLDAYGEWAFLPGFGYGWVPYAPAGWVPYSSGMWSWYAGMGWTWIDSEPWGWMPYHYGMWDYDASLGWFWMPNGFSTWSPALVTWMSGPGWYGWAPRGARPGCNCVSGVMAGTTQAGGTVDPRGTIHVGLVGGRILREPPFEAGGAALLPGSPLAAGRSGLSPRNTESVNAPVARSLRRTTSMKVATTFRATAPRTVLMGSNAKSDAALFNRHQGFWSRALGGGEEPQHVRLGGTLGGRYPAGEHGVGFGGARLPGGYSVGENAAANGSPRQMAPRGYEHTNSPVFLSHGRGPSTGMGGEPGPSGGTMSGPSSRGGGFPTRTVQSAPPTSVSEGHAASSGSVRH
jgi:Family of unknown function (DUF6600)/FecR protein